MIGHTEAFARYRTLSQTHLNFVVGVCHAMPALRADLASAAPILTHPPDHFLAARNPKSEIARYEAAYQDELSRSTLIAIFSYFEAYARGVLREIVNFHGGADGVLKLARERAMKYLPSEPVHITAQKRKLQDRRAPQKFLKYQKYGQLLEGKGFRFPTDLLAYYGVSLLVEKVKRDIGIRAFEIPSIFRDCLLFPISKADTDLYEEIRAIRNDVAHGRAPTIALRDSLRYASELHTLGAKIDNHIVEHFLVIQVV